MSLNMKTFDVMVNNYRIHYIRKVDEIIRNHKSDYLTASTAMVAIEQSKEEYDKEVRELIKNLDNKDEQEEAYSRYMNSLGF